MNNNKESRHEMEVAYSANQIEETVRWARPHPKRERPQQDRHASSNANFH